MKPEQDGSAPSAPPVARRVFSDALPAVEAYAELLAAEATVRGLIGPREVPRLWERHLLNCALVTDLVAEGAQVADLGSGAGLPGLVMALRRPDLHVCLVEPLLRRTSFLEEAVAVLGLDDRVEVVRARAEDLHGRRSFGVVTSRAVASLDKLARWSLPLAVPGGDVLAMKGASAADEVVRAEAELRRGRGRLLGIESLGKGLVDPPVTVVHVRKLAG